MALEDLRDQLGKCFEEFAVMELDSKQLLDLETTVSLFINI